MYTYLNVIIVLLRLETLGAVYLHTLILPKSKIDNFKIPSFLSLMLFVVYFRKCK